MIYMGLVSDTHRKIPNLNQYTVCYYNKHTGVIEEKKYLLFLTGLVRAVACLLIRKQIMLSLAFVQLLSGPKGYRSTHTMAL